jgi:hypothetical protein
MNPEGGVSYTGSFLQAHPWRLWLYRLLNREQCMKFYSVDLPTHLSDSDLRLTASILSAARDRFLDQFPGSRFYVVLFPEHFKPGVRVFPSARMLPFLEEQKINYVDLSAAVDLKLPGMTIEQDGHPTAKADDLVAQRLVKDLGLNNPEPHQAVASTSK